MIAERLMASSDLSYLVLQDAFGDGLRHIYPANKLEVVTQVSVECRQPDLEWHSFAADFRELHDMTFLLRLGMKGR